MYYAGKCRRWMDYIIGFNLNPVLSDTYRESIADHLESLYLNDNNIQYGVSFNAGRVKLVILKFIHDFTKEQIDKKRAISNNDTKIEEHCYYDFYFTDNNNREIFVSRKDDDSENIKNFNFDKPVNVEITEFEEVENYFVINDSRIPPLMNMTSVFDACSDIGASAEEIKNALQYLYQQKYTSYPRSKSERWELPNDDEKKKYAHSVLNALKNCGYPVKDYYYNGYGKEGTKTHSHPCIHPLGTVTKDMVHSLERTSPVAFLVFNEICLNTLKSFEKLPKLKIQKITYRFFQEENDAEYVYDDDNVVKILEENVLHFIGFNESYTVKPPITVKKGDIFDVTIMKDKILDTKIEKNSYDTEKLTDFDVIHFMNENDIGTDATRPQMLKELINLQYIVSSNMLLTTYFGNILNQISEEFIQFIDIDYTIKIERELDEIENGLLSPEDFEDEIKELITESCDFIKNNVYSIGDIFLDEEKVPMCPKHETPMMIVVGKYGRFLTCPMQYSDEGCKNKFSI